jgi:lysophospholipase L1-like esterase
LALGDSLTRGFQIQQEYSYPIYTPYTDILQSRLLGRGKNIAVLNKGIDGDTTSGMLERFNRSVVPEKPDFVIIWAGINDIYAGLSSDQIHENLKELLTITINMPSIPLLCSLTLVQNRSNVNEKIMRLNNMIRKTCYELDIKFIDLYAEVSDKSGNLMQEYSSDGVHLSQMGYIIVGETIFRALFEKVL